jgi:hypothetical protein
VNRSGFVLVTFVLGLVIVIALLGGGWSWESPAT